LKRGLKRALAGLLFLAVAGYGVMIWWYSAHEGDFIFQPDREVRTLADSLGLHPVAVKVTSVDGVHLEGRIYRGPMPDSTALWVLYCHGNAGNVTSRAKFHEAVVGLGVSVLAAEYRGYGQSGGEPDEAGLINDVERFYNFALDSLRISPSRIVVYGFSLGTGPATDLAVRFSVGGLILEAPYTSLPERAQEMYPYLPVRWMMKNRFATIDKIDRVGCPTLIIHASGDRTIPISHGRAVYERASSPKMFLEVRGDHNDAYRMDSHVFFGGLKTFLAQVGLNAFTSRR
jgi:fermentation-respiration switch protein FrsA (DUF1100 family)